MNKQDLKILCLSFWTPPIVRPQSILIGKMIPEWQKQGVNPVIMAYDICGDWRINLPIYKIPRFGVKKWQSKIPGFVILLEYFYYQKLFRMAKKIIKNHDINVIFSFSNPQDSNVLGAMLAKKLKIKFVSYFSDPWFDNPYKSFSKIRSLVVKKMEKYVIDNSDKMIFTNEKALDLVMKKYPGKDQNKASVIPHCYNEKDYPAAEKKSSKFVMSYIGSFYKKRNPEMLFTALQNIIKTNPELNKKLVLRLIGTTSDYGEYSDEALESIVTRHGLQNIVEITPRISYYESLGLMKQSDCLIVIDADFAHSPFLPSKVIDYAGSGKTIVGITPQDSPTAIFIKKMGYEAFGYDELEQLTNHLKSLINGTASDSINKNYLKEFSVETTTAKLINLFEEAMK
jgi:glycosyltransferase involved in cell wall biosynthesis